VKLVLIGSSTGGPGHLMKIVKKLPSDYDACIVIAQHIGELFLPSLVQNFVSECALPILIGNNGVGLQNGAIYFVKGDSINEIAESNCKFILRVLEEKSDTYAPNINRLFMSAARIADKFDSVLAVLLTGIGDDGAVGMLELKKAGAYTIAESEGSAIVYGMPRCAKEIGATKEILSIDEIVSVISRFG